MQNCEYTGLLVWVSVGRVLDQGKMSSRSKPEIGQSSIRASTANARGGVTLRNKDKAKLLLRNGHDGIGSSYEPEEDINWEQSYRYDFRRRVYVDGIMRQDSYWYLRFLSLRRNVTYLGSPKLGRLYRYVKSLPTFCFSHIFSSTSSSTYFATSLYHTKFALSNGAKSLICYIGK